MEKKQIVDKVFKFLMNADSDELCKAFECAAKKQGLRDKYFGDRYMEDKKYTKCQEVSAMKEYLTMANISQIAFLDYIFKNSTY